MMVRAVIKDREKFVNGYGAEAAKLVDKFGGKYLGRAPGAIPIEGIDDEQTPWLSLNGPLKRLLRTLELR